MSCRFFVCLLLMQRGAWAQPGYSSLQGQITDPSGSAVPGATVAVRQGASVVRTVETSVQGRYQIAGLNPGKYDVRIIAKGFALAETTAYDIAAGRATVLSVRLTLGVEIQRITVADSLQIDLDPAANAGALVLRGSDLDALADNRDDLANDVRALAGPAAGPNGARSSLTASPAGAFLPRARSARCA